MTNEAMETFAHGIVQEIDAECRKERLFIGTVNAQAVIRKHIRNAILAERKRCADVARTYAGGLTIGGSIADKIEALQC